MLVALAFSVAAVFRAGWVDAQTPAQASAAASVAYLAAVMDQFHDRFPVYDDVSAAGNHFHAFGKIPNGEAAATVNGSWTENPHSGATCIRNELQDTTGTNFGGFYFLNGVLSPGEQAPHLNFGGEPDAGIDLTGATALTFWVRGARGGEQVEFFMGGVGHGADPMPYPDSTTRLPPATVTTLTTTWQRVTIDLAGANLGYVLGGFGWVASAQRNPGGVVFFLDDIEYELSAAGRAARLNEARLLRSFGTMPFQSQPDPVGDFDLVLRNVAFVYDNALALLAFLADGSPDSLRRARLIGDAFVYAQSHDRFFDDGRLRDAYAAGDLALPPGWLPNGRPRTVPVSGFFDEARQQFIEIEQAGSSTGNNAWAMIALLALARRTGDTAYVDAAERVGAWIRATQRDDTSTFAGFHGGFDDPEGAATARPWASTEHNLDLHAAFTALADLTGDRHWLDDAALAGAFVEAMWDASSGGQPASCVGTVGDDGVLGRGCYLAGTLDPEHCNAKPGQLPMDTQPWVSLAVPAALVMHPNVLGCVTQYYLTTDSGFTGVDFNDDRDGVWFEGTAHAAVARSFAGDAAGAELFAAELRRAQETMLFGEGGGLVAAAHDGISTGFDTSGHTPFRLFRRLHVGATAWNVFAQLQFNPFYQATLGPCDDGDACTDDRPTAGGQCSHTPTASGGSAAVICRLDNFLAVLNESPAPICGPRCPKALTKAIARIRHLITKANAKPQRCQRVIGDAAKATRRLLKRVSRLARKGSLLDRAPRLTSELQSLDSAIVAMREAQCLKRSASMVGKRGTRQ